jgi:hypothetical protein
MGILHDMGGLTTQWIDNVVNEHYWEIAQFMSSSSKQEFGPNQWDFLIDNRVTCIRYLAFTRASMKWYAADMTNFYDQNFTAAQVEFTQVGLC